MVHDGLVAAGFRPVGVDLHPMPSYPGPIFQADATMLPEAFLDMFRFIWASPPCLKETPLHASARREQRAHSRAPTVHIDLITPTQRMLDAWAARTGGKFVIENVENTKLLRDPIILCGSMFSLSATDRGRQFFLERHRKIETNWGLVQPWHPEHPKPCVGIYGQHARVRAASYGGRGTADPWENGHGAIMREAMGVERDLSPKELSQGIPPAFSEYVGRELLKSAGLPCK